MVRFKEFFNKQSNENAARDKFLARFMGIFNEEIIRIWCKDKNSEYENIGSPTIRKKKKEKSELGTKDIRSTLDFTLRKKKGAEKGNIYVAESKCLLQFQKYKHLELDDIKLIDRLDKDDKRAFKWLLELCKRPNDFVLNVSSNGSSKSIKKIDGGILIWASINKDQLDHIKTEKKFHDILSLEDMINDLIRWRNKEYRKFLNEKSNWVNEFISFLKYSKTK